MPEVNTRFEENLRFLEKKFPGKLLLQIEDVAEVLGVSIRTVYNCTGRRSKSKFPVKPVRVGRLLKFRIHDIARHISEL